MAIQAISSVRNSVYNTVSFGSKKKTDTTYPQQKSSALKAVPVAVLLAMSPMVAKAQDIAVRDSKPETTLVAEAKDTATEKVIKTIDFPDASEIYGDCELKAISTDDNDKSIEIIELGFLNTDLATFFASAEFRPNGLIEDMDGYWIKGHGDRTLKCNSIDQKRVNTDVAIPVNEKFFDVISQIYEGELPIIVDKTKKIGKYY